MKRKAFLFAASALLSTATLFAQEAPMPPAPPTPPPLAQTVSSRVSRLTTLLSLTHVCAFLSLSACNRLKTQERLPVLEIL
jgi:hypothetical protein